MPLNPAKLMMKMLALLVGILFLNASWYEQKTVKSMPILSEGNETIHNNTTIVRGTIIKKDFPDKGLRNLGLTELHFQIAGEDYFIKFCGSNVSRDELERHVNFLAASDPVGDNEITLEVEMHDGELDTCRTQIQSADDFIKFCDSNVRWDELERHVDFPAASDPVGDNEITLDLERHNGPLDICYTQRLQSRYERLQSPDERLRSRIERLRSTFERLRTRIETFELLQTRYGRYVIIHRIIESPTED
ncbi:MAG: hypothetical protein AAGA60_21320 [Cyanobacteria bacterium P01_E01_bin.42]